MPPKRRAAASAPARRNTRRREPTPDIPSDNFFELADDDDDEYEYDGYSDEALTTEGSESGDFEPLHDDASSAVTPSASASAGPAAGRGRGGPQVAPGYLTGFLPIHVRCSLPGEAVVGCDQLAVDDAEVVLTGLVVVLEPTLNSDDLPDDSKACIALSPVAYDSVAVGPVPLESANAKKKPGPRKKVTWAPPAKQHRVEGQATEAAVVARPIVATAPKRPEDDAWECVVTVDVTPPLHALTADHLQEVRAGGSQRVCHYSCIVAVLSPQRPQRQISFVIPPGSTYSIAAAVRLTADGASWSSDVSANVIVTGNRVPRTRGVNLAVQRRWLQVKPGVRRAPITTSDGHTHFVPEGTVCEFMRVDDSVLFLADKRDLNKNDSDLTPQERAMEKSKTRAVADMADWMPFRRFYTPARSGVTVRIRRYPHRAADVIGELAPLDTREAHGIVEDHKTKERYVVWATPPYGYSRLDGTGGLFLVECGGPRDLSAPQQQRSVQVFVPPRWYTPRGTPRGADGVDVVFGADEDSPRLAGRMHGNETKLAAALVTVDGAQYVQWVDGGTSAVTVQGEVCLVELEGLQRDGPFQSRVRRSRLPPEESAADVVIDLDAVAHAPRAAACVPPVTYETRPTLSPRSEALRRHVAEIGDVADTDPDLFQLRSQLGSLSLAKYPRISLDGGALVSSGDEEDGDSDDE